MGKVRGESTSKVGWRRGLGTEKWRKIKTYFVLLPFFPEYLKEMVVFYHIYKNCR